MQLKLFNEKTLDSLISEETYIKQDPIKLVYDIYGEDYQNNIVVEELSELTKAVTKYNRKRLKGLCTKDSLEDIADEIADVSIVLDELKHHYKLNTIVEKQRTYKLNRLSERINTTLLQHRNNAYL